LIGKFDASGEPMSEVVEAETLFHEELKKGSRAASAPWSGLRMPCQSHFRNSSTNYERRVPISRFWDVGSSMLCEPYASVYPVARAADN